MINSYILQPCILLCFGIGSCVRPAGTRSNLDSEVGISDNSNYSTHVIDGQAKIKQDTSRELQLWAQAPVLELELNIKLAGALRIEVRNCMKDSILKEDTTIALSATMLRSTWCQFNLNLSKGIHKLTIAPQNFNSPDVFRFADMGDIQKAMSSVDDIFKKISSTPNLHFVMSTGDVVNDGYDSEYDLFEKQLEHLNIPFYSTIGNHELTTEISRWHDRYGRLSVHFRYKNTDFSFVDSGNAGLDRTIYKRLERWLEEGKDRVHIFGTHYPPFDPIGLRNAGFRSRNEAAKLLSMLARGNVDLTIYGHIHSLYKFENAGIPAYISGGGGALPEKLDGIDRHFLVIEVDSIQNRINSIDTVRVKTP